MAISAQYGIGKFGYSYFNTYVKDVAESQNISDNKNLFAKKYLSDLQGIVDSKDFFIRRGVVGSFSVTDIIAKSVPKTFSESLILNDYLKNKIVKIFIEIEKIKDVSIAEILNKHYTKEIDDSISVMDSSSNLPNKNLGEIQSISDLSKRTIYKLHIDVVTPTDLISRDIYITIYSPFNINDYLEKLFPVEFSDSFSISDSYSKKTEKNVLEILNPSDTIRKVGNYNRTFVGNFYIGDRINTIGTYSRTFDDVFTIDDELINELHRLYKKIISETITTTDLFGKVAKLELLDSMYTLATSSVKRFIEYQFLWSAENDKPEIYSVYDKTKIFSASLEKPKVSTGLEQAEILIAKREKPTIYRASYLIELG